MTPSQQRTAAARRAPGRPVLLALLLWGAIGLPQRADGLANEYCSSWSALTTGGSSTSACPPCSKIGGDPCKVRHARTRQAQPQAAGITLVGQAHTS